MMVVAVPQKQDPLLMSEVEYLKFERQSEIKHEFVDGEVYAMTGASWNHNVICANTVSSLNSQLGDKDCTVVSSDLRLRVAAKIAYRYPDVMVIGGEPQFTDNRMDTITNPIVIIEVLSASTALVDRNEKLNEYIQLATVQEYMLIAQNEARIERYLRQESEEWLYRQITGLANSIELSSIGCMLHLSDIYRKVTFEGSEAS